MVQEKTKIKGFKKVADLGLDKERIEGLIQKQPINGCVLLTQKFQTHLEKVKKIILDQFFVWFLYSIFTYVDRVFIWITSKRKFTLITYPQVTTNDPQLEVIKWAYSGYARVERSVIGSLSFRSAN